MVADLSMKGRSIALCSGRFQGSLTGMERFFQIDKRPIGVICLARSRILPAGSRLIYALRLLALKYIQIQSHPVSIGNISISGAKRYFPLTCPKRDYKIAGISLDRMPLKARSYSSLEGGYPSDRPAKGSEAKDPLISKREVHEQEDLSQPSSAKLTGLDDGHILTDRRTGPITAEGETDSFSEKPQMRKDDGLILRDRRTGPIAAEDEMKASSESPYMRKSSLPQVWTQKSQIILPGSNFVKASAASYAKTNADLSLYNGRRMLTLLQGSSQPLAGGVAHPASAKLAATQGRITPRPGMLHIGQGVSISEEIMRKVNTLNASLDPSARSSFLLKGQRSISIGAVSSTESVRDASVLADSCERIDIPALVHLKPPEISKPGNYPRYAPLGGLDTPFNAVATMKPAKEATFAGQAASVHQDDWQDSRDAERRMDISSLAERVYTIIERKTKIEMERRGLYSRS